MTRDRLPVPSTPCEDWTPSNWRALARQGRLLGYDTDAAAYDRMADYLEAQVPADA